MKVTLLVFSFPSDFNKGKAGILTLFNREVEFAKICCKSVNADGAALLVLENQSCQPVNSVISCGENMFRYTYFASVLQVKRTQAIKSNVINGRDSHWCLYCIWI